MRPSQGAELSRRVGQDSDNWTFEMPCIKDYRLFDALIGRGEIDNSRSELLHLGVLAKLQFDCHWTPHYYYHHSSKVLLSLGIIMIYFNIHAAKVLFFRWLATAHLGKSGAGK